MVEILVREALKAFDIRYREIAEGALGRKLLPEDADPVPPDLTLPAALEGVYATFGSVTRLTTVHNRLRSPGELEPADGMTLFYEENQGVVSWGFRAEDRDQPDPTVFQGQKTGETWEWYSEEVPVSDWMEVMTYWQLVNGGFDFFAHASGVPDGESRVSEPFPFRAGLPNDALRFYGTPSMLVGLAGSETMPSVWAGAATAAEFAELNARIEIDWDFTS